MRLPPLWHSLRVALFDQRTGAVSDVPTAQSVLDDTSEQLPDCIRASVGWARSSRRAASAFMTTALIGWLISATDADSCPERDPVRGCQLRLSFVTSRPPLTLASCSAALHACSGSSAMMSGAASRMELSGKTRLREQRRSRLRLQGMAHTSSELRCCSRSRADRFFRVDLAILKLRPG